MQKIRNSALVTLIFGAVVAGALPVVGLLSKQPGKYIFAIFGYLLSLTNFALAKSRTVSDDDLELALSERPIASGFELLLNVLVVVSFVFQGVALDDAQRLVIATIATRSLDSGLVGFALYLRRSVVRSALALRAHIVWLIINMFVIATMAYAALRLLPLERHYATLANLYFGLILADLLVDYSVNWRFYRRTWKDWGEAAKLWDSLQGTWGDTYHQKVVFPALKTRIGDVRGLRILDIGAGNGAMARSFAQENATVVATDKYAEMLEMARARDGTSGIQYIQADLEQPAELIDGGNFDVIVAVFVLQDCATLENPFAWIAVNLKEGGTALIVAENARAFEKSADHVTTRRRFLDDAGMAGRGRRQLITWILMDGHERREFSTVTRHWATSAYRDAALKKGLHWADARDIRTSVSTTDLPQDERRVLDSYARQPRFQIMVVQQPT